MCITKTLLCLCVVFRTLQILDGADLPAVFDSTTWTDSVHGGLVFTTPNMDGWPVTVSGTKISEWKCVNSDTFDTDGTLIFVTRQSFKVHVSNDYYAYVCLKMTKVTDVSYRYYVHATILKIADFSRILIRPSQDDTDANQLCREDHASSGTEYGYMVKSDSISAAVIRCPYVFLGRYDYDHQTYGGISTCGGGGNDWDICTDKTHMQFDLAECSTKVANAESDTVYCVDTVPIGTDNFITVYNPDASVDPDPDVGVPTYRFTCFGVSADGTSASVAPRNCRKGQTTTALPSDNNNVQVGATMTMTMTSTPSDSCTTCDLLDPPEGGSVTVETYGAVTTAYYTCNSEFDIYGSSTRVCGLDDAWTDTAPTCKCIGPAAPTDGAVSVSASGDVATYSCILKYVLNGDEYRYCSSTDNAWNGTEPTCDRTVTAAPQTDENLAVGEVIGIAGACVVIVVIFVILFVFYFVYKRMRPSVRRSRQSSSDSESTPKGKSQKMADKVCTPHTIEDVYTFLEGFKASVEEGRKELETRLNNSPTDVCLHEHRHYSQQGGKSRGYNNNKMAEKYKKALDSSPEDDSRGAETCSPGTTDDHRGAELSV